MNEENVFTNIVVSHCGYEADKHIAENVGHKIGLIVGGHSHTLLYSGNPPDNEVAYGPYPTAVDSLNGSKVLVVQASAFTRYVGNLTVFYDEEGRVANWEGAPIFEDINIPQGKLLLPLFFYFV